MFRRLFCFPLTLLIVLAGCSRSEVPAEENKTLLSSQEADHRHSERARDKARFRPARELPGAAEIDVQSYHLKGHFDWTTEKLLASVLVKVKVLSSDAKEIALNSRVDVKRVRLESGAAVPFKTDVPGFLRIDISERGKGDLALLIEYEAASSNSALEPTAVHAVKARPGDPIQSSVVYTLSEPEGAPEWLPCHDTPSDRAYFSSEFSLDPNDTFIANGDLERDETIKGTRYMRYATRYSLPTYLMAFAAGEFAVATQPLKGLPISIYARKGLPVDYEGMLKALTSQMTTFQRLLIPYPFEKYAVVVLPDYRGGMEHAGITFQAEIGSTQGLVSYDFGLSAHELGHQWFGDLVTIKKWDDLWIKEGMATLLAEEATRDFEDKNRVGRLFGRNFGVQKGDAVFDPALAPDDKYTSGPYGRSAWVFTQIRSVMGEDAFWGMLRKFLQTHAFGSISTEEFFKEVLEPALEPETLARVRSAIVAKALPTLEATDGAEPTLALTDADKALVAPLEVRWYDGLGEHTSELLLPGKRLSLVNTDKKLLVLDPRDHHVLPTFGVDSEAFIKLAAQHLVPTTEALVEVILSLGANVPLLALGAGEWPLKPQTFVQFWQNVPSEEARVAALQRGCAIAAKQSPEAKTHWGVAVGKSLLTPPYLGFTQGGYGKGLSECRLVLPETAFAAHWERLENAPADPGFSDTEVVFLTSIAPSPTTAFKAWGSLAKHGSSVRARMMAMNQLVKHLKGSGHFEKPTEAELGIWKALFREVLTTHRTRETLYPTIAGIEETKDLEAVPLLAELIPTYGDSVQGQMVCAAHRLTKETAAWAKFKTAVLLSAAKLSPATTKKLEDPASCDAS